MDGMCGKFKSHPIAANPIEINFAFCHLQMLCFTECFHFLFGGKKWNVAITLREGCITIARCYVKKNNLKFLLLIKPELKSLWL